MFKRLDDNDQYDDILEGWETRDNYGNIQRLEIIDCELYQITDKNDKVTFFQYDIDNMILLLTTAKKYFKENV